MKTMVLSLFFLTSFALFGGFNNHSDYNFAENPSVVAVNTPCEDCWEEASEYGDQIAEDTGSQYEGNAAFYSYLLSCDEENNCNNHVLSTVVIEG